MTLIGHSRSAFFVALYAARYPSTIDQPVLMEPDGFSAEIMAHVPNPVNLFTSGHLDMAYRGRSLPPRDHATLDDRTLAMPTSGVWKFFSGPNRLPP